MKRGLAIAALVVAGCSKPQPEKRPTPAEVASALVDDVSPLDSASAAPTMNGQPIWDAAFCNVAPERDRGASFSQLAVSGTCNFQFAGSATCQARGDDYYAIVRRRLSDGNELEIYINVEYYTGPGTYDRKVEMLALVRRGTALYRWSNTQASVTVGYGQGGLSTSDKSAMQAQGGTPTELQLTPTLLGAEPGTATNGSITLSGTIGCIMKKLPQ